jgi:hypothetical protein
MWLEYSHKPPLSVSESCSLILAGTWETVVGIILIEEKAYTKRWSRDGGKSTMLEFDP